jgi:dihydrodipicolinate synthase/N-acetylneuraminate lyase
VQTLFDAGRLTEARTLQARLISANAAVTTLYNVPGLKAALDVIAGYGGTPRMPLQPLNAQERAKLLEMLHLIDNNA